MCGEEACESERVRERGEKREIEGREERSHLSGSRRRWLHGHVTPTIRENLSRPLALARERSVESRGAGELISGK